MKRKAIFCLLPLLINLCSCAPAPPLSAAEPEPSAVLTASITLSGEWSLQADEQGILQAISFPDDVAAYSDLRLKGEAIVPAVTALIEAGVAAKRIKKASELSFSCSGLSQDQTATFREAVLVACRDTGLRLTVRFSDENQSVTEELGDKESTAKSASSKSSSRPESKGSVSTVREPERRAFLKESYGQRFILRKTEQTEAEWLSYRYEGEAVAEEAYCFFSAGDGNYERTVSVPFDAACAAAGVMPTDALWQEYLRSIGAPSASGGERVILVDGNAQSFRFTEINEEEVAVSIGSRLRRAVFSAGANGSVQMTLDGETYTAE